MGSPAAGLVKELATLRESFTCLEQTTADLRRLLLHEAEVRQLIDNEPTVGELLKRVHQRLQLGIDIHTFADGTVEVRWKRAYEGEWSDERFLSASLARAGIAGGYHCGQGSCPVRPAAA